MQTRGVTMGEFPGGVTGLGVGALVVLYAAIHLFKSWSKTGVSRTTDESAVAMLKAQRVELEEQRRYTREVLDALRGANDELVQARHVMDEMRKDLARMTNRIASLEAQVRALGGEPK